jgi:hypothetical protein
VVLYAVGLYFAFCVVVFFSAMFVNGSALDALRTQSTHGVLANVIAEFERIPGVQRSVQSAYEQDASGLELARLGFRLSLEYLLFTSAFIVIFAAASAWMILKRRDQKFINLYIDENRPKTAKLVSATSFYIAFGSVLLILALYGVGIDADAARYREAILLFLVGIMLGYLLAVATLVYLFNRRSDDILVKG